MKKFKLNEKLNLNLNLNIFIFLSIVCSPYKCCLSQQMNTHCSTTTRIVNFYISTLMCSPHKEFYLILILWKF